MNTSGRKSTSGDNCAPVRRGVTAAAACIAMGLSLAVPATSLESLAANSHQDSGLMRAGGSMEPAGSRVSAAAATGDGLVHYGGGAVVTGRPRVYLVFWGSAWGTEVVNAQGDLTFSSDFYFGAPKLQEMFKGLGTGGETWSGVMTQYCEWVAVGATSCPNTAPHVGYPTGGALAGTWYDNRPVAIDATRDDIAAEAYNAAANHFGDFSPAAQYFILSPTRSKAGGFNVSPSSDCAWHWYVNKPAGPAFTSLPYIMDIAGSGCDTGAVNGPGPAGELDGYTMIASHEYAETITDLQPTTGWDDPAVNPGEVADKCTPEQAWLLGQAGGRNVTTATGTFALAAIWSNDTNRCDTAHRILASPVPSLIGDTLAQTGQALNAAYLVLGAKSYKVDCNNIGLVTAQSPAPGTQVAYGTPVSITIGTKPAAPTVCP